MVDPLSAGVIPLVIATLGLSIGVKQLVKSRRTAQAQPFNSIFRMACFRSVRSRCRTWTSARWSWPASCHQFDRCPHRTVTGRAMQAVAQNTDRPGSSHHVARMVSIQS